MNRANIASIERLLREAGAAHGEYEAAELNGVYDEEWAAWYAGWAIAHGFNDLVARPVDAERLSRLLVDLNEAHRKADAGQPWPAYYAERLAEQLG